MEWNEFQWSMLLVLVYCCQMNWSIVVAHCRNWNSRIQAANHTWTRSGPTVSILNASFRDFQTFSFSLARSSSGCHLKCSINNYNAAECDTDRVWYVINIFCIICILMYWLILVLNFISLFEMKSLAFAGSPMCNCA